MFEFTGSLDVYELGSNEYGEQFIKDEIKTKLSSAILKEK